jgi:hypothetical protein
MRSIMTKQHLAAFVVVSLALGACQAPPSESEAKPELSSATTAVAVAANAPNAAPHEEPAGGCADHRSEGADDHPTVTKDPATGATMTTAGQKLSGAKTVTVKELVENPDAFSGKTVRVEGNVNAMCHHRRGWFSVQDEGERGRIVVRVITTPAFLVPAGSIGKKARAEGKVEVIEVPESEAKHFATGHGIGEADEVRGPVKNVIVRATGAEFI